MDGLWLRSWTQSGLPEGAAAALPHLERQEAANNLLVGLLTAAARGRQEGCRHLDAVQHADGTLLAVGLLTTKKYLLAPAASAESVRLLAAAAAERHPDMPGWLGPTREARLFADVWRGVSGQQSRIRMHMRIQQLTRVEATPGARGHLVPVGPQHRELLALWTERFARDIGNPRSEDWAAVAEAELHAGTTLLWANEEGEPVSMCAYGGPTPHGIRIRKVYTPPRHRRRGFAGTCVAAVSERLLAEGRHFCFLYTDLANPTSNGVYRRVGYRPVCDVDDHELLPARA